MVQPNSKQPSQKVETVSKDDIFSSAKVHCNSQGEGICTQIKWFRQSPGELLQTIILRQVSDNQPAATLMLCVIAFQPLNHKVISIHYLLTWISG